MSTDEPTRPVFLTREQRDYLDWAKNHAFAHGLRNLSAEYEGIIAAWDAAPADAWAEIADEKRKHRAHCRDGNCFAEDVMFRLGGIKPFGLGPFDIPDGGSS